MKLVALSFPLYCGLVCGICRLVLRIASAILFFFIFVTLASGQDFSGTWRLKSQHVEAGALPEAPAAVIEIEHRDHAIECAAGSVRWSFTTDGKEVRVRIGRRSLNTVAKWEGSALLVNTIVNDAARNYTQMDRWAISRDRRVLTVTREIAGRDVEATLVYERADAAQTSVASAGGAAPADPPKPTEYTIEAGTRVPLLLVNSVSMKHSSEGDRVYLRTAFPILSKGVVVIPPGSNVAGTLTFVKPPGHVKGRGEVFIRFDSLTLSNGVTRDFRARVDQVDASTRGHVDPAEGSIKGEGPSGTAGTVAKTTAAGASVGGIAGAAAGHAGAGLGVGAVAGAVAGLLLSHGQDTVLAEGSSVEMVLDRPLVFGAGEVPSGERGR